MTDWCILRTSGGSTLRLAHSLELDDFEAWTPTEFQVKRDRKTGERVERIVAVMPSYVFARARRLADLVSIAMLPTSQHPPFTVFRHVDRFALVDDRELHALRQIERRAAQQNKPVVFPPGAPVKFTDGPFQGLTGRVVELSKGQHTLVAFPGFHIPVKFSSWQLTEVQVNGAKSEQDSAAAAA